MAAFQPIHLLLVMTGGGIGAGLRYLCGRWALALFGPGYPWGTLSVNIAGSLAMGLLAGVLARTGGSEQIRLFIGVGQIGRAHVCTPVTNAPPVCRLLPYNKT